MSLLTVQVGYVPGSRRVQGKKSCEEKFRVEHSGEMQHVRDMQGFGSAFFKFEAFPYGLRANLV